MLRIVDLLVNGLCGSSLSNSAYSNKTTRTHHALPVQSSVPLEHDDKTASGGYIRAMPAQEPVSHDILHLLDDAAHGFASKHSAGMLGNRRAGATRVCEEEVGQEPTYKSSTPSCT